MARFDYRTQTSDSAPALSTQRPELAYVAPFFAFLLVMVPGSFGHAFGIDWESLWKNYLPELYTLKTLLAALLLWYFWPCYTKIRWHKWWLGIPVGIAGTFLWIATDLLCRRIGLSWPPASSDIYNPDALLGGTTRETLFLCIRVAGPSLVVPLMEELFFRDFIMRLLINRENFQQPAIGAFTWLSLLAMSALFGINHGRMFAAGFVYGLLMGILLIRTKSLGACIVAHGITNFTLYLYVIYSGDWQWM